MGIGRCSSKTVMGLLGLFFFAAAIAMFAVSGYVIVSYRHFDSFSSSSYTLIPAVIVMFIGILFLVAGAVGCCSICKDNKCYLCSFFFALLLVFILLITASSLVIAYRSEISTAISNATYDAMAKYGQEGAKETEQLDFLQSEFHCCGSNNYTDWEDTRWFDKHHTVPFSCCNVTFEGSCTGKLNETEKLYQTGCFIMWKDLLMSNLKYITTATVVFLILLIIGMVASCVLFCYKPSDQYATLS